MHWFMAYFFVGSLYCQWSAVKRVGRGWLKMEIIEPLSASSTDLQLEGIKIDSTIEKQSPL